MKRFSIDWIAVVAASIGMALMIMTAVWRVNPVEGGGLMHWSRFVDASIAALILLLQPLLGEAAGERWAIVLYPPLLMLPLFLLLVRNLGALGDRRLVVAGLLVAFTGATFLHFFAPMRIDHHGWQLLLSLAMVPIALRRPSFANGLIGAAIINFLVEHYTDSCSVPNHNSLCAKGCRK